MSIDNENQNLNKLFFLNCTKACPLNTYERAILSWILMKNNHYIKENHVKCAKYLGLKYQTAKKYIKKLVVMSENKEIKYKLWFVKRDPKKLQDIQYMKNFEEFPYAYYEVNFGGERTFKEAIAQDIKKSFGEKRCTDSLLASLMACQQNRVANFLKRPKKKYQVKPKETKNENDKSATTGIQSATTGMLIMPQRGFESATTGISKHQESKHQESKHLETSIVSLETDTLEEQLKKIWEEEDEQRLH